MLASRECKNFVSIRHKTAGKASQLKCMAINGFVSRQTAQLHGKNREKKQLDLTYNFFFKIRAVGLVSYIAVWPSAMTSKMDSWTQLYHVLLNFLVLVCSIFWGGFLFHGFVVSPCLKQQTSTVKRDVACAVYNIVTDGPYFRFLLLRLCWRKHRTRVR
jgi:hypothetical protein